MKHSSRTGIKTIPWVLFLVALLNCPSIDADPSPDLPFGDINVLVLTDTHSWVGGHGPNEPHLNADYGDVLSFYERLKEHCDNKGKDLYFVANGDWIDGTGLSLNGDAFSLTQILEKMPWDAVNIGNHELYHADVIEFITKPGGFVDWWGDRYLSSNIVLTKTMEPIGYHYRVLRGKETNVLTFGFLYNMKNNVDSVTVKEVESVVEEDWFSDALHSESFDAILVLAHMGVKDPLVNVILDKIRQELGDDMPVEFITGHTHFRDYAQVDGFSASFEAGRFLDTLGFVSFPTRTTAASYQAGTNNATELLFKYKYIDANKTALKNTLGVDDLPTENGAELSRFIDKVQESMGLTEEIGCANETYFMDKAVSEPDSLWGYFNRNVVSTQFESNQVLLLESGSWRYHLLSGRQRMDDVIAVAPYNDSLYEWKRIPTEVILQLNVTLNESNDTNLLEDLPKYVLGSVEPVIEANRSYDLITGKFEVDEVQRALSEIDPDAAQNTPLETDQTLTSIWVNHIRDHAPCEIANPGSGGDKEPHRPHHDPVTERGENSDSSDSLRLGFVLIAVAAVLALGSVNVWQRGRSFRHHVNARERATLDALREYCDEDEDDDVEEEEGEFV